MNLLPLRRGIQLAVLALLIITPLMGWVRLDFSHYRFILFGQIMWIQDSYLIVLSLLFMLFFLLTLIKILGRVPCGWACPRNTLNEWVDRLIPQDKSHSLFKQFLAYIATALLASFTGFITFAYFFDWHTILNHLLSGNLGASNLWFLLGFSLFVFLDLIFIRHSFCKTACPYGLMQKVIADEQTMSIRYRSADCTQCDQCVRHCYMNINPKNEDELSACLSCGDCTVACRQVFQRSSIAASPSLGFRFGKNGSGSSFLRELANPRLLLFLSLFALSAITLTVGFLNQQDINVSISMSKYIQPLYINRTSGQMVASYVVTINNASSTPQPLRLRLTGFPESQATLPKGAVLVGSGESKDVPFSLIVHKGDIPTQGQYPIAVEILNPAGQIIQTVQTQLYALEL